MVHPARRAPRAPFAAVAIALPLLAAAGAKIAAADDAGESIRLAYRAAPGCPDEDAFLARIDARTARARLVGSGQQARTFTVELAAGAHPSGSVTVTDGSRSEGTRRLDADTCDDVADALALMVALALDPHALSSPSPPPPASASVPSPVVDAGAPLPDASEPSDSSPPPASTAPLPPSPSAEPPIPDEPSARTPRPDRHFFAGVDFAVATSLTPTNLFAGAPYVGWRATRASLFGPSLRVAFLRAGTGPTPVTAGSADFTFTVGRLDGCAMLWPSRPLRLGACARAEVGILDVTGEGTGSRTEHSAWVAAGALARVEWSFLGPFVLDLGAGPAYHITANRFYFLPGAPTDSGYQVPDVGFLAEAGLGAHFL